MISTTFLESYLPFQLMANGHHGRHGLSAPRHVVTWKVDLDLDLDHVPIQNQNLEVKVVKEKQTKR